MNNPKFFLIGILLILTLLMVACDSDSVSNEIVIGNRAPDFELTASDGTQVKLSEYKGQPVLLFFHMAGG